MHAPARISLLLCALALGCGNKIGDSCTQNLDCSNEGDRICDSASPGGYCTIEGCDYGTCPDEAVCVRFYPISQLGVSCATDLDCASDEICALGGTCAPMSNERRFCMVKCDSKGDCRDFYECRDAERMAVHGGEPVPSPEGERSTTPFCAPSRPCKADADCDMGDVCDRLDGYCVQTR